MVLHRPIETTCAFACNMRGAGGLREKRDRTVNHMILGKSQELGESLLIALPAKIWGPERAIRRVYGYEPGLCGRFCSSDVAPLWHELLFAVSVSFNCNAL